MDSFYEETTNTIEELSKKVTPEVLKELSNCLNRIDKQADSIFSHVKNQKRKDNRRKEIKIKEIKEINQEKSIEEDIEK